MNEIVKIVMKRDGMTELEATNLVQEVAEEAEILEELPLGRLLAERRA